MLALKIKVQPGEDLFQNDCAAAGLLRFHHEVVMSVQLLGKKIMIIISKEQRSVLPLDI